MYVRNSNERYQRQAEWTHSKVRVMVATNAFGMGINKLDVRTVLHLDLPQTLEAYYQEAGRAGRDGSKAYAILFFNEQDIIVIFVMCHVHLFCVQMCFAERE